VVWEEDDLLSGSGFLIRRTDVQAGHLNLTTLDRILSGSNLSFVLQFGQTIFLFVDIVRSIFFIFSI
jgi:hypothetical protein